jgi:hypothetical protein
MSASERIGVFLTKLRDPRRLLVAAPYVAAAWLTIACAGYAIALQQFAQTPQWTLTTGSHRLSGTISELKEFGLGTSRHYRLRIAGSAELSIPPEIAYPLWSANPEPNRVLADLLYEGRSVTVSFSGAKYPVILDLTLNLPGEKQEKLLDAQDSIGRFGVVRTSAESKSVLFAILALVPIPGLLAYRWRRAKRSRAVPA